MSNFFPDKYEVPVTSNYMKFQEGSNTFRVLSPAITGYEYWNTDNKPVRSRVEITELPSDIKMDVNGAIKVSHFWAFVVYNYEAKRVQILELTQKGIMKAIKAYVDNPKWGDPKGYDFIVTRTGSGLDTEYLVTTNPHSDPPAVKMPSIHLEALYEGLDPFTVV